LIRVLYFALKLIIGFLGAFKRFDFMSADYLFGPMSKSIPTEKARKIREEFSKFPFPAYLGVQIENLGYGSARLKLPFRPQLTQGQDYVHGGAITSLCDSSVALALATMIDKGEYMLTIELKTNYTAPADDDIIAKARIIHKGNHTAVGEVDVTKSDGTLVAKSIVTYFLYNDEPAKSNR
jgi:uncharacterized protein (TIGR00369 family)